MGIETLTIEEEAEVVAEIEAAIEAAEDAGVQLTANYWGITVDQSGLMVVADVREGCCPLGCVLRGRPYEADLDEGVESAADNFNGENEVAYALGVPHNWVLGFETGFDGKVPRTHWPDGDPHRELYDRGYAVGHWFREQYQPYDMPDDG